MTVVAPATVDVCALVIGVESDGYPEAPPWLTPEEASAFRIGVGYARRQMLEKAGQLLGTSLVRAATR